MATAPSSSSASDCTLAGEGPDGRQGAADLIQQCADHLAVTIRQHTSSWHMLQRVFVEDLYIAPASDGLAT